MVIKKICLIEGCGKPVSAKGLCKPHYERQRIASSSAPRCTIDGCDKPRRSGGLCLKHHKRKLRSGDPLFRLVDTRIHKLCSIEGCTRQVSARGLCHRHYPRLMRYGDPEKEVAEHRTLEGRLFIERAFSFHKEGCLFWPFSRTDSGYALHQKKRVHRIICEMVHGPAPEGKKLALHSCGNGHLGCMAPCCVYWGDNTDNQADRLRHGTSNRGERHGVSKLTAEEVREIRRLHGSVSRVDLAKRFKISSGYVKTIWQRKTWVWLDDNG